MRERERKERKTGLGTHDCKFTVLVFISCRHIKYPGGNKFKEGNRFISAHNSRLQTVSGAGFGGANHIVKSRERMNACMPTCV